MLEIVIEILVADWRQFSRTKQEGWQIQQHINMLRERLKVVTIANQSYQQQQETSFCGDISNLSSTRSKILRILLK